MKMLCTYMVSSCFNVSPPTRPAKTSLFQIFSSLGCACDVDWRSLRSDQQYAITIIGSTQLEAFDTVGLHRFAPLKPLEEGHLE